MNEEGDKYKIGKSIKDTKLIFEKNIKIISFMENKLYKIKSSKLWIFFNLIIFNNKMFKFINNKYLIF